jgi:hypothetical protein
VSGEPCAEGTKCQSATTVLTISFAVCISVEGKPLAGRGASCRPDDVVCAPKLGCARFGPEVCLPLCRTNADCPPEWPRCYLEDRIAAEGDVVGDCFVAQCDATGLPAAPPWTQGAVVTRSEFEQCQRLCGARPSNDPSCARANCPGALLPCLETARVACAGALAGPCRTQYAAANCSTAVGRIGARTALEACIVQNPECTASAERACVSEL